MSMTQELYSIGLIPVIKIENPDDAVPLAKALIDGGLPAAEITFRTACAAEAIKNITEAYPDMLVGAGTVLTCEQVDAAIAAGSKFLVSPGLNPKVTAYALSKGIPMLPGCSNPSDIEAALELGLKTVKFFPAEAAGGLKMLKAMEANWCDWTDEQDAILMMGTGRYELPEYKGKADLHIPIIYGDYFFTEAILKLRGSEFLPW